MQYIKLGNSGLEVSPICIGCMGFREPSLGHLTWALGEEGSRPVVKHAIEAGINFFDTANLYSQGTSEENIGKLLKEFAKRESIVIATKLGAPTRPGPNVFGLSRKHDRSRQQSETSWNRLHRSLPDSSR